MQLRHSKPIATVAALFALSMLGATSANAHANGTCHSHADEKVCEDDGSANPGPLDAPAMQLYIPYQPGATQGTTTFGAKKTKRRKPRRRLRRR